MDVIQMARDLGVELQKSETYANYLVAREAAEKDDELQTLVREFNLQKVALTTARQIEDADSENVKAIGARMREVYSQIMQRPTMQAFDTAKKDLDKMVSFAQHIIEASADGEDPSTIQEPSCGGDCAGCSGCG